MPKYRIYRESWLRVREDLYGNGPWDQWFTLEVCATECESDSEAREFCEAWERETGQSACFERLDDEN